MSTPLTCEPRSHNEAAWPRWLWWHYGKGVQVCFKDLKQFCFLYRINDFRLRVGKHIALFWHYYVQTLCKKTARNLQRGLILTTFPKRPINQTLGILYGRMDVLSFDDHPKIFVIEFRNTFILLNTKRVF